MPDKKILIVDDEPSIRDLCVAVLRTRGFDAILASNGREGLEAYAERHEQICLVLSDIAMPDMDGIEMTRQVFELHTHANVILMSGAHLCDLIPDELRRLCSVLEKPFTGGRLIECVEKCLQYDHNHHPSTSCAL